MNELVSILLVEDDEVDVLLFRRALSRLKLENPLFVASNGEEALGQLRGQENEPALPRPYVVMLDLNMPRMGGLEFLEVIREDPELSDTVVFVLTTSAADEDLLRTESRNVAGYLLKKNLIDELAKVADRLADRRLVASRSGEP
ncbi:MAG: response regulator [Acidobacteriota bacterium]